MLVGLTESLKLLPLCWVGAAVDSSIWGRQLSWGQRAATAGDAALGSAMADGSTGGSAIVAGAGGGSAKATICCALEGGCCFGLRFYCCGCFWDRRGRGQRGQKGCQVLLSQLPRSATSQPTSRRAIVVGRRCVQLQRCLAWVLAHV